MPTHQSISLQPDAVYTIRYFLSKRSQFEGNLLGAKSRHSRVEPINFVVKGKSNFKASFQFANVYFFLINFRK